MIKEHEPKYDKGNFFVIYFNRNYKNKEIEINFNEYNDGAGTRQIKTVNIYTTFKGNTKKDRNATSHRTTIVDAYHTGTEKSDYKTFETIWNLDNKKELKELKNKLSGLYIQTDPKYNYWKESATGKEFNFSDLCQTCQNITIIKGL